MMLWKSISIFIVMLMGLFSFNGHTRAPAVDPVMGLSIEEYENVDPAAATPYNFDQQSADQSINQIESTSSPLAPRSFQENAAENRGPSTYFYILMSLLPFVIWYGVMKNLENLEGQSAAAEDNMYDLNAEREKRAVKNTDDTDLPKAS